MRYRTAGWQPAYSPGRPTLVTEARSTDAVVESSLTQAAGGSRFREMLARLTRYSDAELNCVPNHRLRRMLVGVVQGAETPEVVAAFEILYDDYFAIRKVGNFIFGHLDSIVERAVAERQEQLDILDQLVESGELSADTVAMAHRVFEAFDRDRNGELSKDEFLVSDLLSKLPQTAQVQTHEELFAELDVDGSGGISLEEFARGTGRLFAGQWSKEEVDELIARQEADNAGEGRTQAGQRFDEMVEQFALWETKLAAPGQGVVSDNPRLRTVLKGCFVGAHTKGVVDALRIVYEDFPPLRMAGDLIFKLMRRVVGV